MNPISIPGRLKRKVMSAVIVGALLTSGVAHAAPVQWTTGSGGNDHWYDFISPFVSWSTARAGALSSTYLSMSGYLATITSSAEQNFILGSVSSGDGWLGGSDSAVEGTWKWMDGPEAGNTFWTGGPGGTVTGFASWYGGEPNNLGGEDFLHFASGQWNDIYDTNVFRGYFVEYGGNVPEPASLALLGLGLAGLRFSRRKKA